MEKLKDIQRMARYTTSECEPNAGTKPLGEALKDFLDRGNRQTKTNKNPGKSKSQSTAGEYRVRTPTRSERLNRALKELRPAAFKVHMLIWTWRGAPAKGNLPFFTIRSLGKFCSLTRPTLRKAITELVDKGWIQKLPYNAQCKNTLYRLIPIRKINPLLSSLGEAPRSAPGGPGLVGAKRPDSVPYRDGEVASYLGT